MNACTTIVKDQPTKKPCLAAAADDGDCVSNIHDNILSHVFSCLPIEDAVRTSILSKDWKYKWTSLYKLDIHDRHWEPNPQSFINFLNTTIPSIQCLTIFRLWCIEFDHTQGNDFQRWVSTVLEHNLEILELDILSPIDLPCTLLNSTSLRRFCFGNSYESTLKVAANNIAPNLTSLCLCAVRIVSGKPTLKFTFPVLETLSLRYHEWLNVESVEIRAPSLTAVSSSPLQWKKDYNYSIVIVAPKVTIFDCITTLEKIKLNGSSVVSAYLRGDSHSEADLYFRRQIGSRAGKLLNKFSNVEELVIHGLLAKDSHSEFPFCRHDKLRRLSLTGKGGYKLLFELLHSTPSLKFLFVNLYKWRAYKYEALKSIPACITSHLEEVALECDKPAHIYDLAKFLFKNAVQLKKFHIFTFFRPAAREKIVERLSAMPRCSTSLTIDVTTTSYDHDYYRLDKHLWRYN